MSLSFILAIWILVNMIGCIAPVTNRRWLQNDILWTNNRYNWRHFLNTLVFGEIMLAMMFSANFTFVYIRLRCVPQFLKLESLRYYTCSARTIRILIEMVIFTSKNVSPSARYIFIIAYVGIHTKDAAAIDQPSTWVQIKFYRDGIIQNINPPSPWAHPGYVYVPLWNVGGW